MDPWNGRTHGMDSWNGLVEWLGYNIKKLLLTKFKYTRYLKTARESLKRVWLCRTWNRIIRLVEWIKKLYSLSAVKIINGDR